MAEWYVRRNGGVIDGLFGVRQPGEAEELLPDSDPEVAAYLAAGAAVIATLEADRQARLAFRGVIQSRLTQIAAGRAQLANDETALAAAGNLAAVKPIVANLLNRQDEIMEFLAQVLQYIKVQRD